MMQLVKINEKGQVIEDKAMDDLLHFAQTTGLDLEARVADFGGTSIMAKLERWSSGSPAKHNQIVATHLVSRLKASLGPKP